MFKNQEICRKLVEREVIYNLNELVYELSRKEEYMEELMDLMVKNEYSEPIEWHIENDMSVREAMEWLIDAEMYMPYTGNAKKQLKRYLNENDEDKLIRFADDHNIEPERIEVYEHWIVSEWFAYKLKGKGEIVGEFMGMIIWGRTCTGHAIFLDGVIKEIASDMEILEGQKNEWKL
jgi:hypothetical protein